MNFLKLIRYKNLIMILLTMVLTKYALLHSFITNSYLSALEFLFLILSILLIAAAGFIVNDIYNIEADKINKPNKILIDKTITKENAWKYYYIMTFLGLILGVSLSIIKSLFYFSAVFIIIVLGIYIYSKYLKKLPLIGNFVISFFNGLIIYIIYLFGFKYIEFYKLTFDEQSNSILFFQIWMNVIIYSFFVFLITLITVIIKDIENVNGDLKIKAKTLPIVLGRKRASEVAFFFSCGLTVYVLIILQNIKNETIFLVYLIVLILLPLLYFMYKLWFSETKKDFNKLSRIIKLITFFGLLSMLLFKL